MTLDDLYGAGTLAAFTEAVGYAKPEPGVVQTGSPDDSVHVEVRWPDESDLRIDCFSDRVHFAALFVSGQREGMYRRLTERLPDLFKARGVKTFTASGTDAAAEATLIAGGGFASDGAGGLVWEL